jgi:dipeptidase E
MKLYLSSYRIGNHGDWLAREVSGEKKVGVILNAMDFWEDAAKLEERAEQEFADLRALGLVPSQIDLKDYFDNQSALEQAIEQLDALWVTGGNVFVLRRAFSLSGMDSILLAKTEDPKFVYGGYSAGIVILTPTLNGIHLIDDAELTPPGYPKEVSWDCLSIIPFSIVPHYKSDHPETKLADKSIAFMIEEQIPFIAMRDGEVYILD